MSALNEKKLVSREKVIINGNGRWRNENVVKNVKQISNEKKWKVFNTKQQQQIQVVKKKPKKKSSKRTKSEPANPTTHKWQPGRMSQIISEKKHKKNTPNTKKEEEMKISCKFI